MKKLFIGVMIALTLGLTSCQVKTSNLGDASQFENGISYFQDSKTGAVYAVVVIRKQGSMQQEGVGLAYIPKAELTPAIVKQIKHYK